MPVLRTPPLHTPAPTRAKLLFVLLGITLLALGTAAFTVFRPGVPTIALTGIIQAKEVKNASRFGGRVKAVLVREGQTVQAGQPLIVFDDIDVQAKLTEAEATLEQAQARQSILAQGADGPDIRQAQSQVQQAEQNLKMLLRGPRPEEIAQAAARLEDASARQKAARSAYENANNLLQDGIISQQKLADIQTLYQSAESALKSAQANYQLVKTGTRQEQISIARSQLAAAKAQLDKLRQGAKPGEVQIASAAIRQAQSAVKALSAQADEATVEAPISGIVNVLNVNPGELVPAGRPVIAIMDYQNLWTDIYVPESNLAYVSIGQPVKITSPVYQNTVFKGRVAFVNPKSEFVPNGSSAMTSEQASFRVKVDIESRDPASQKQLLPGMKIRVEFTPHTP